MLILDNASCSFSSCTVLTVASRAIAALVFWLTPLYAPIQSGAATLSNPEVDHYNMRVGTQTFAGTYQFTTNTLLVETAQVISGMGSDIIKLYLGSNFPRQYHYSLSPNITNLLTLVRDDSSCRRVFDMPFRHVIAWAYPFGNQDAPFVNGYVPAEGDADYRELYDLTRYLLTNYNNSGKTFYLGHWEGDGYFMPWTTNPPPTAIQGMIAWLNNRQKAIDDAKASTAFTNVNVCCYAEANRVRDAMVNGPNNNQRVINMVVPYVTNLDFVSYSSYDAMNLGTGDLYATLDYMHSMLPTNKAAVIPGERLWIGEYGWGDRSPDQQEPLTRAYIQRLLNYRPHAPPYILFWEIYNNEPGRAFCLVDSNNVKVASYYLHERFINRARLAVAQFRETHGRLPADPEFVSLVSPILDRPLTAPANLSISNLPATLLSPSSARLSGLLAQGVYGEDAASVSVFYGLTDGGATATQWEQSAFLGVNSHFNPFVFSLTLTNLAPNTNYFFRFYATNSSGEKWSLSSSTFSSAVLNPSDFGTKLRIAFAGRPPGGMLFDQRVLVPLSTNVAGFSYSRFASANGEDLRFTDSGGLTPILHEIDQWNTNGTSEIWVRVPVLTGTNDFIWAYWGNPNSAVSAEYSTNGAVWSPDYDLVWHLRETSFPYSDSSRQHPGTSGVAPSSAPGVVGRGCAFNGASQYLNAGNLKLGDKFTLSAWVKLDAAASNIQTLWANKAGGWNSPGFALFINSYQTGDGTLALETGNGTEGATASTPPNAVTPGVWHYVAAVVDRGSGAARLFVDGVDQTRESSIRNDFPVEPNLNLGRMTNAAFFFRGIIDEVRIQEGLASTESIVAQYVNVIASSTFLTALGVETTAPELSIRPGSTGPRVAFPSTGIGYRLYSATNLTPPVTWTPFEAAAALTNGEWEIALPRSDTAQRFFRLESN